MLAACLLALRRGGGDESEQEDAEAGAFIVAELAILWRQSMTKK